MTAISGTTSIGVYEPKTPDEEQLKVSLLRVKLETAEIIDDQMFEFIDKVADAVDLDKPEGMGHFIDSKV